MDTQKHPSPDKPAVEHPALSMVAPFLTYIADLVFATLVFIVSLLATWALHYLGNTLAITWFRFSWRIFEMFVISFGTLLCVLFFLRASVDFAKQLKRQLPQPIELVPAPLFRWHPSDIVRRFGDPVRSGSASLVVCSGIVLTVLYFGISFAELVRDDCDDTSILACEMLCETGPDFPRPITEDEHVTILKAYAKYMETKRFASLLRLLSGYSPQKVLTATAETLAANSDTLGTSGKDDQEQAARAIWRAGEKVMLFRLKAPKLLPRGISLHEYRKIPEWLLNDINKTLEQSKKASKLFEERPSLENAVKSCEANRKTMLLLFLARKSRQNHLFDDFQQIVEACRKSKTNIALILPDDDPRKEFLLIISASEQRRYDILNALKTQPDTKESIAIVMRKAIDPAWEAIETAYRDRSTLLQLCSKVRDEKYSEIIS